MCNQTAALVARALEETGIATVTICLLKEVMEKVPAPRGLYVPFPFGYPLGRPGEPELQHSILAQCLDMLEKVDSPGAILDFKEDA